MISSLAYSDRTRKGRDGPGRKAPGQFAEIDPVIATNKILHKAGLTWYHIRCDVAWSYWLDDEGSMPKSRRHQVPGSRTRGKAAAQRGSIRPGRQHFDVAGPVRPAALGSADHRGVRGPGTVSPVVGRGSGLFRAGYPTSFFVKSEQRGHLTTNIHFGWHYQQETLAEPQPCLIPIDKPQNAIRIFVLGESAAMGTPDPSFGFARILEVMLRRCLPGSSDRGDQRRHAGHQLARHRADRERVRRLESRIFSLCMSATTNSTDSTAPRRR